MADGKTDGSGNWKPMIANALLLFIGALIGAVLGYLGTKANAEAQVAAAQQAAGAAVTSMSISVYGPIHATETAEARATPTPMKIKESPTPTTTPTPTLTPEPGYLAIEQIPGHVFVFAGNNTPDGGYGTFDLIYDEEATPIYQMTYNLPEGKYGYAGMVFQFPDGVDLSVFQGIEFNLAFQQAGDTIELYIRDIGNHNTTALLGGNGQREIDVSSSFSNFPDINFSAVREIGLIASTTYVHGDHQVQMRNVRLVK